MHNKNPFSNTIRIIAKSLIGDNDMKVVYRNLPPGMGAGYAFPPINTIFLPKIDCTKLKEEDRKKYNGFVFHELLHHALSSKEVIEQFIQNDKIRGKGVKKIKDKHGLKKNCMNGLEDARIEKSGKYNLVGSRIDLNWYRANELKKLDEKFKDAMQNPWGWLIQALIIKLGGYGILSLAKEQVKFFEMALKIVEKRNRFNESLKKERDGNIITSELALEIIEEWQAERDFEFEKEQKMNGSESSSEGRESSSEESEDSKEKNSDEDSEEEDSENKDDEEKNKEKLNKKIIKKAIEKAESEVVKGPRFKNGRPKSIEEEYGWDQQKCSGQYKLSSDALKDLITEMGLDPEKFGLPKSNWSDDEDKRDPKGEHKEKHIRFDGDPYIPYVNEDREIFPKKYLEEYSQIYSSISVKVNHLRSNITRQLLSASESMIERDSRRGVLDPVQYYKIIKGSKRVKKTIQKGIDINTALTLVVDLSGSMHGARSALAARVAALFGEALQNIPKVKFEIVGYNSSPLVLKDEDNWYNSDSEEKSKELRKDGYTRTEIINYWIFKTFEENWVSVKARMGSCSVNMKHKNILEGGSVGGCNCDHENLRWAAYRLCEQPHEKKVMIVLCDGQPSGYNGTYGGLLIDELHNTVADIKRSGIKLFCFGIHAPDVGEFYDPEFKNIENLADLDLFALEKMSEFLIPY